MKTRRNGQAVVELALVLPLFVFVVMGIYDFSQAFHAWTSLNSQCVQAARIATRRQAAFQMIARDQFFPNSHGSMPSVSDTFWAARSPWMRQANYSNVTFAGVETNAEEVTISAQYTLDMITPGLSSIVGGTSRSGALTISASARERKE